ncbi:hypothetical protein [Longispora urticae]
MKLTRLAAVAVILGCVFGASGCGGSDKPPAKADPGTSASAAAARDQQGKRLAAILLPEDAPGKEGGPTKLQTGTAFTGSPLNDCDPGKDLKSDAQLTSTLQRGWQGGGSELSLDNGVFGYEKLTAAEVLAEVRARVSGDCRNAAGASVKHEFLRERQLVELPGITMSYSYCTKVTYEGFPTPQAQCSVYFGREMGWGVLTCVVVHAGTETAAWQLASSVAPAAAARLVAA